MGLINNLIAIKKLKKQVKEVSEYKLYRHDISFQVSVDSSISLSETIEVRVHYISSSNTPITNTSTLKDLIFGYVYPVAIWDPEDDYYYAGFFINGTLNINKDNTVYSVNVGSLTCTDTVKPV